MLAQRTHTRTSNLFGHPNCCVSGCLVGKLKFPLNLTLGKIIRPFRCEQTKVSTLSTVECCWRACPVSLRQPSKDRNTPCEGKRKRKNEENNCRSQHSSAEQNLNNFWCRHEFPWTFNGIANRFVRKWLRRNDTSSLLLHCSWLHTDFTGCELWMREMRWLSSVRNVANDMADGLRATCSVLAEHSPDRNFCNAQRHTNRRISFVAFFCPFSHVFPFLTFHSGQRQCNQFWSSRLAELRNSWHFAAQEWFVADSMSLVILWWFVGARARSTW